MDFRVLDSDRYLVFQIPYRYEQIKTLAYTRIKEYSPAVKQNLSLQPSLSHLFNKNLNFFN